MTYRIGLNWTIAVLQFFVLAASLLAPSWGFAQKEKETDWEPPLANGDAPECPDHFGNRILRSEVASMGSIRAFIRGTAFRNKSGGCSSKAELVAEAQTEKTLALTGAADHGFAVVDFSPDGRSLLLEADADEGPPNWDNRSVSIAVVRLDGGGIQFMNAWDLFGWGKCYATVEPQGFAQNGKVIILARPSTFASESVRPNCVSDWELYETDLHGHTTRLPQDSKIPRFGKVVAEQREACKSDPDIVGACFSVHGRLSEWNGGPPLRVWKVGTKRILGDHDAWPLPEDLAEHMSWDVEAWGNFEVCPFTKERPGEMQMVCIESAKNVVYKSR